MARVLQYKVKLKLTRGEDGAVKSDLNEESLSPIEGSVESLDAAPSKIIQCAKEISDFNQLQISMAEKSMFASEQEREIVIRQKRLVE